jgi:YegS/Rv2252/BmrU family lipid kinase
MEKTILIFNRFADKGKLKHSSGEVQRCLSKAGIKTEPVFTHHVGHAIDLAEKAVKDGFERIIIVGGDGTINEAVNGLVKARQKGYGTASLGVIPNGRGNDFGYSLKIPGNLEQAVEIITADNHILVDIGSAGDGTFERYFCNGSGFGIDSAINHYAAMSRLNGFPSYLWGLLKAICFDIRQPVAKITYDDGEFEMPMLLLTAMNGMREGGGFNIAPKFDVTDGLLDVCVVGNNLTVPQLLPLIPLIMKGNLDHPNIRTFKTSKIQVEIEGKGLYSQVDGETIFSSGTCFFASICPWKVDLIAGLKSG